MKETLDNKYKQRLVTYNTSNIAAFADDNLNPVAGINAVYIGMEQLNEDYERFETEYFQKDIKGISYTGNLIKLQTDQIMHTNQ